MTDYNMLHYFEGTGFRPQNPRARSFGALLDRWNWDERAPELMIRDFSTLHPYLSLAERTELTTIMNRMDSLFDKYGPERELWTEEFRDLYRQAWDRFIMIHIQMMDIDA